MILAYFPEKDPEHFAVTALDIRWTKKDLMETFESWVDATLAERARTGLKQERIGPVEDLGREDALIRAAPLQREAPSDLGGDKQEGHLLRRAPSVAQSKRQQARQSSPYRYKIRRARRLTHSTRHPPIQA